MVGNGELEIPCKGDVGERKEEEEEEYGGGRNIHDHFDFEFHSPLLLVFSFVWKEVRLWSFTIHNQGGMHEKRKSF